MKLFSTNNSDNIVSFSEAVLRSLPNDKGLYMPLDIPRLQIDFEERLSEMTFEELSFEIAYNIIGEAIPKEILSNIITEAINFEAPLVNIHDNIYSLELFHGPTLAFKDFGARFMSRVMNYFRNKEEKLYILVATSGDTGGAVASGFLGVEGIEVVILFPKGKVSPLQQKQLTTLGKNITAIEVEGTFDDCQSIVKRAFLDDDLSKTFNLSSANSINISRLIPQSFYYFNAWKQILKLNTKNSKLPLTFVVPSGNFGNITAGILGQNMGLPIQHFVAATNANDIVPQYINTGQFNSKASIPTISNAMDVGNPSNFPRMSALYGSTWNIIKKNMKGYSYSDSETKEAMIMVYEKYKYTLDPHGAIGYLAAVAYQKETNYEGPIIFLETAHPSKFTQTVENTLGIDIKIPERLAILSHKKEDYSEMKNNYDDFKNWFQNHFN